ncbi:hypothetical protein SETIT_6G121400v2 [Setaria italica]|uniref:F-box domain-containing protein n=1 Tax=Setaria italica TaxID=4555 RepID=A0A368RKX0_SETIT|nr:hypothetical protein SETIT_6G121400v2 [Setaria italica]
MTNDLIRQERNADEARGKAIHETRRQYVQFEDLPLDVLYSIVSRLPPKEYARTSVLSSSLVCNCNTDDVHLHTDEFIHKVNAVLQKHQDMVVETLEINDGSISRLQHMQLSFVYLKLPLQFKGFPNLKKLYIQVVHASRKDLEHVLSHCCKLEWLRIDRCNINDELTVDGPLPHLLYLYVENCKLTEIKFHAVNLATFKYEGAFIPIDLSHSSKLQNAYFRLNEAVFQHALISLLKGLPNVQNLTLRILWQHLEKHWLWDSPLKFSNLRHLQLFMFSYSEHVDKILYLVSFLRATPFIEKLDVHYSGFVLWLADVGPRRQDFGLCKKPPFEEARRIAKESLSTISLPQNARLCVI